MITCIIIAPYLLCFFFLFIIYFFVCANGAAHGDSYGCTEVSAHDEHFHCIPAALLLLVPIYFPSTAVPTVILTAPDPTALPSFAPSMIPTYGPYYGGAHDCSNCNLDANAFIYTFIHLYLLRQFRLQCLRLRCPQQFLLLPADHVPTVVPTTVFFT